MRKAVQPVTLSTSQPKFMPKKPVSQVSGMKMVATMVRRFMTTLSLFDTVER